MADRLTQLQDAVNRQAENLCNSIGILQQHATPSTFPGFERSGKMGTNGGGGGIGVSNGAASVSVGGPNSVGGGAAGALGGANPQSAAGGPPEGITDDYAKLFASLIARTAKDIDVLIDSLPSDDLTGELQVASLKRLEKENQEAALKLEAAVRKGERLLDQIQTALHDIAQSQLETSRVSHEEKL